VKIHSSGQIFEKYPNLKFHENPFSGNRVIPCGQTDGHTYIQTDRQIDIAKLIFAFAILRTRLKRCKYIRPSNKVTLFRKSKSVKEGKCVRFTSSFRGLIRITG